MTQPLKIGIAGLGTVGAGVVKLLAEHNRLLALRGGRPLKLVAVSARSIAAIMACPPALRRGSLRP